MVAVFAVMLFSHNLADVDLWGNLGFVRQLPWQTGFHRTNTYSFTEPASEWINHEWGAEYILHLVHATAGNTGLLLLKVAIGLALLLLMDSEMRRDRVSGPARTGLLMLVLSTLGYGFSTRPHLFSYLLLAILIVLLRRGRLRTVLGLAPGLGCLWANLHGAFFIGLIVLLVALCAGVPPRNDGSEPATAARGRSRALLAAAIGLFLVGTLATPYGTALWRFVTDSAGIPRPYLSEWAPFHLLRDCAAHSDFVALVIVVAFARIRMRNQADRLGTALTSIALLAALAMRRNIPIFALCAGLCAGPWVDRTVGPALARLLARLRPCVPMAAMLAMTLLSGWQLVGRRAAPLTIEIPVADFPVQTINFMRHAGIRGNLLIFFDWAEYCIWKLHPDCRVFMDGRFRSAYSAATIRDYLAFLYAAPGWRRALDAYDTELILVHRENPCVARLAQDAAWQRVFENEMAVLYARAADADAVAARIRAALPSWRPVPPHFP